MATSDPELPYTTRFLVTVSGFGRKRHQIGVGYEAARALYLAFGDTAEVRDLDGREYTHDPDASHEAV